MGLREKGRHRRKGAWARFASKVIGISMAVVLAFTMMPVSAFTAAGEGLANAVSGQKNAAVSAGAQSGGAAESSGDGAASGQSESAGSADQAGAAKEEQTGQQGSGDKTSGTSADNSAEGSNANQQGSGKDDTGSSAAQGTVDGSQNAASEEQNGQASGGDDATVAGEGDAVQNTPGADEEAGKPAEQQPQEQRKTKAWEKELDATTFGGALTIDAADIEESAAGATALPDVIPATLRVSFQVDPSKAKDDAAVAAGDTIEVSLPSFVAVEDAPLDVFRLNEDDTETTNKIAVAKVKDGTLKVTLENAAVAEGAPAIVRGFVDVPATLGTALLGEEETEQPWVVQKEKDGTERVVMLTLPTYKSVFDVWKSTSGPLGTLGSLLGITNSVVTPQQSPRDAVTEAEVTTQAGAFNHQVSSKITWCDNNSGDRPRTGELEAGFIPLYSVDGGTTYKPLVDENTGKLLQEAIDDLHLSKPQQDRLNSPFVSITQTLVNTYEVLSKALPSQLVTTTKTPVLEDGKPQYEESGDQKFETTTETTDILWQLKDVNEYPGYVDGESSTWDHEYKMLTAEVEFTVIGKIGEYKLTDVFKEEQAEYFQFGASIDNKPQGSISVAEAVEQGALEITDAADGKSCVISGTLPAYDENGYPIVYHIAYTEEQGADDYFQPAYDNSASANHGGDTTAVYEGGTLTLRHMGKTEYHGTKVWLDNGNPQRPEAVYTLWRYSTNGGSAATATQVRLETSGMVMPTQPSRQNATSYVEVSIPAGSKADKVDLHELLYETYGDAIDQLPKYDPDGYPYVYALREEPMAGYEQVFGQVLDDGSVNDTPPTYEAEDGTWTRCDSDTRPSDDHFIYNAGGDANEGYISNRLTGTTTVNMTKTWSIAAFQDDLQNVVCEFTAQSRPKGSTDESDWKNVEGTNAKQTLTGWNAETLTKTLSASFPKYDAHGTELEYRWVETNVTVDGVSQGFESDGTGGGTFQIAVNDAEGNPETLDFTSAAETVVNDDGTYSSTITNTFQNITDQHVDKYWEQADGTMAQIAPDPVYSDGNAQVQLYQDGVLIGTFTLDGQTDKDPTKIQGLDDATWQETSSYHADFQDLPKYSPDGVRYTYLVLEVNKEGWNTERTYDAETRTTRIDNTLPVGEGSEIRVTKKWLDGDDAAHRYDVKVELVAARDLHSQGTNPDGSYRVTYKEGEVVATVTLSAEELWFAEIDVPIGGVSYKDFDVREVALVNDNGTPDNPADDTEYPVVTRTEAQNDPAYKDELWVNAGWTNEANKRVATPEHVYEVKTQDNETLQSCEVTNRRLGLLDLTVAKTWKDGLGADEGGVRPDAVLTLSCDENPNAFFLNDEGELIVSVSDNTLPVTDADNNPIRATIVDDAEGDGSGDAQVVVNANADSSTYEFFGLPKYDANGLNVHYTVNESWAGNAGDYRSTKTVGDYEVEPDARHFHDTQKIDVTNTRYGVRDVKFFKEWHDKYVNETLGQRPDIYLTLWQVSGDNPPKTVDGYINYRWSPTVGDDATNYQTVTISGLPKYDSGGNEITYYAEETMTADGVSLDYSAPTFNYDSLDSGVAQDDRALKVNEDAKSNDPTQDGTGWAIHENGTFVNRLSGTLTANGTKLWENIPGNFAQGDLPAITVYLQQKLAGDEHEWPDMYANAANKSLNGTVASTDKIDSVGNNQFRYVIDADYEGNPLPRYDEEGNRFEYRAVEIVWGLLDQPGGFTAEDLEGVNLADLCNSTTGTSELDHVFTIQHGETGSFLLRNVYSTSTDKGKLTVKKLFNGREAGEKLYPDVTFSVYRYYIDDEGNESDAAWVASHTITQEDFRASQEGADGNRSASYTFNDLEIYAPDGSHWIYYVVEQGVSGYTTYVGPGDIKVTPDGRLMPAEEGNGGWRSEDLNTVNETIIADDEDVDVTFANDYRAESADLNGTKVWNDYNNVFSVRPTTLDLTFKRTAGDVTENVTVQSENEDAANYFKWTAQEETGDWTFVLNNIEKWAPNGQPWTYIVTEKLPSGAEQHYTVVVGSSQAASTSAEGFRLQNALKGQAAVEKVWVDGGDPYGLRPESVSVQLQARTVQIEDDGSQAGEYSEWQNAYEVWTQFANGEDLASVGLQSGFVNRVLEASNGWKASWSDLPLIARVTTDGDLYQIEYRAVETKIGDQSISAPDADGVYGTYHPYQPSQETTFDGVNKYTTTITNTLEATSIAATKTWAGDGGDQWNARPENTGANNWKATFFLQRSTDGTDWEWVVEAGSEADPGGSATQEGVVSLTITGDDTSDSKQVKWENLPEYDTNDNKLQYRIVEQVPGSYDVTGATQVADTDTAHRYYVVGAGNDGSQTFTNTLRTVDLTGTKAWEDFGTGFAPEFNDAKPPLMTLYRAVDNGDGTFGKTEKVMQNGSPAQQPTWSYSDGDAGWTFVYEDLPAADKNDRPYVYWATETAGSGDADGFYPVYEGKGDATSSTGSHDAVGTTVETPAAPGATGQQANEAITNVATKLALDKISNWEQGESLNNIELSVQSRDGKTTYGVWQRDKDGKVTTWTLRSGGTKEQVMTDDNKMTGEAAGYIVGLPAGDYKVVETGEVPDGYAIAPEVNFQINADGTATFEGVEHNGEDATTNVQDVVNSTEDAVRTITVTAEDPVLRGHLQLTKKVSSDGTFDAADAAALEGATFDLYRVDTDEDADNEDDLIASGLTTNDKGVITTVDNDTRISEKSSDGTFDLTYGGKYITLSGGLPEGEYYFVERNATPGAVLPGGDDAKSEILEITQDKHFDYTNAAVSQTMANEAFNATVELIKYDTTSRTGINGTEFNLKYRPEGSKDSGYPVDLGTFTTGHDDSFPDGGKDGVLVLPDLEKGDYLLTETKNTGYDIAGDNGFTATFTIDNADDERTFMVWGENSDATAIDFTVTNGKLDHGAGIPNARQFGQVTLRKLGVNGSIDATFDLQMKAGEEWKTVTSGLETGNAYALTFNADGVTATAADTGNLSTGQLRVTGLTWNKYRLAETATAPGYTPENADGQITREFEINRNTPNMSVSLTLQNNQTDLEINKQSDVGQALAGAEFTITGVGTTTFADGSAKKTVTSDSTGLARLVGQLVVGGTYDVYESKGPSGYDPADEHFQVTVAKDGSLDVVGGDNALPERYERADLDGDGAVDNAFSFMATNNHMAIDLIKVSADDGTTSLAGAAFRLTGQCMDNNSTHTYTTGEDGTLHIDAGLMGGVKYSLVEDVTPAGYLEMEPLYFYMSDRGEIDPVDINGEELADNELPADWKANGNKISFTAADEPTRLTLQKVDEGGKPLAGATFTVTPTDGSKFADGTTAAKTLTTELNDDGTVAESTLAAQLVVGSSYTIQETGAPEGYELVEESFTVTVGQDGTLAVTSGMLPDGYTRPEGTTFVLSLRDTPVEIGIVKYDATDGAIFLPGATFAIEGDFAGTDETRIERTTDADGRIDLEGLLIAGKEYTVTETKAPAGYELRTEPMKFKVENDGTLTQTQAATGFGLSDASAETIEVSDVPIEASFVKTGTDSPEPEEMAGAQFTLAGDFVNQKHETVENKTLTLTTYANGQLSFVDMRDEADAADDNTYNLIAGESYKLTEVTAPAGYEVVEEPFVFTVGANGTLSADAQAAEGTEGYRITEDADGVKIMATDTPINVQLQKKGSNTGDTLLSGAVFELYRMGTDPATGTETETPLGEVKFTDAGALELTGLVGGSTYRLHETQAPAGYELMEDLTFTVDKNGAVQFASGTSGQWAQSEADGAVTITATDPAIEMAIVKHDAGTTDAKPLAGAVFEIAPAAGSSFAGSPELNERGALEVGPSDEEGNVSVPAGVLVAGNTYTLAEVTAPEGYELAGSVEFTVDEHGVITLTGASAEAPAVAGTDGTGMYTASVNGDTAVITATDHPVELAVAKTDGGEGLLPGAEFTATAALEAGETGPAHTVTATTGADGTAVLTGLIAGKTYTLAETKAPAGYELLTDTLEFTVQPDGIIDAGLFPPAAFAIGESGDAVSVADNPLLVSLLKQAPNGAPLAGAEFTVEGTFPDGSTSKTFTSNDEGVVFADMQLSGSAEGTAYTVTETEAPEGYELPDGTLQLLVYDDGTVAVGGGSSADMKQAAEVSEDAGAAVVTLDNTPLPGTTLPQTGDSVPPWAPGVLGLGLLAILAAGIASRLRGKPKGSHSAR